MGVGGLELQPQPPPDAGVVGKVRAGGRRRATGTQCTQAEFNVSAVFHAYLGPIWHHSDHCPLFPKPVSWLALF